MTRQKKSKENQSKSKLSFPTPKTGRPSSFSDALGTVICERLSQGESLRRICGDERMPDKSTVLRWLAVHQEFRDQYARAREAQADYWAEEIIEISDDGTHDYVE